MTKLTEAQRVMLLKAAARDDGAVVAPRDSSKSGVAKIIASLIARKLLRHCKSRAGQPVWRNDERGQSVSLIITRAGRTAIDSLKGAQAVCEAFTPDILPMATQHQKTVAALAHPRAGTKQALLVEMLSKEQGATLEALITATGWLPHTTRAALTGLRKRGYAIERMPMAEGRGSIYRIATPEQAAA